MLYSLRKKVMVNSEQIRFEKRMSRRGRAFDPRALIWPKKNLLMGMLFGLTYASDLGSEREQRN